MGFWDRVGGAAKWITDPKQILTAAGFVFGGPVGAGVGRAVGGLVPQKAGPVPWGALGADTSDFRKSTLADGLQWRDAAQAGQDFMSGYSAGKVGQQIPGIKDLEGAFAQEGLWGGSGMPGGSNIPESLPKLTPGEMPGQSVINAERGWPGLPAPYAQQPMPGVPAPYSQAGVPPMEGSGVNLTEPPAYPRSVPYPSQEPSLPFAPPQTQPQLPPGQIPGQDVLNARQQMPGVPAPYAQAAVPDEGLIRRGVDAAGKWFGELTPMEQIYLATQVPQIASSVVGGGGHKIGREGTALLGEMGMFSRTPRYQPSSFDRWRSA